MNKNRFALCVFVSLVFSFSCFFVAYKSLGSPIVSIVFWILGISIFVYGPIVLEKHMKN